MREQAIRRQGPCQLALYPGGYWTVAPGSARAGFSAPCKQRRPGTPEQQEERRTQPVDAKRWRAPGVNVKTTEPQGADGSRRLITGTWNTTGPGWKGYPAAPPALWLRAPAANDSGFGTGIGNSAPPAATARRPKIGGEAIPWQESETLLRVLPQNRQAVFSTLKAMRTPTMAFHIPENEASSPQQSKPGSLCVGRIKWWARRWFAFCFGFPTERG